MAGADTDFNILAVQASEFCIARAAFAIRSTNYSVMHCVFIDFDMTKFVGEKLTS